jgi:Ca2+-binding RTX toxin-like protein
VDATLRSHPLTAGYRDLERDGTALWAACACDSVVGRDGAPKASKSLVKLGTDGYLDESWTSPPRYQGQVQSFGISVSQADGALFLGAGGSDFLARFSKDPGAANPDWVRDTSGQVQVVETMDGQLLVGGHFWEVSDDGSASDTTTGIDRCGFRGPTSDNPNLDPFGECQTRKGLAAYSFGGALDPGWDPTYAGKFNLVWALEPEVTAQGPRLHTGGEFTSVSGVKQLNYARLSVDATPPTISSVSPADGATEVAPDANAVATFSEAIDTSTLTSTNFTLTKQDDSLEGTTVSASVSYDPATKKATLNPDASLDPQSTYTATIKGGTDGVKDSAGNALANDEVWSFTTTLPCTITGTSAAETITGTAGDDVICAGAGNDTIQALEGNDTIKGEGGADQLHGGIGDDHLEGGLGTDTANFTASVASISASLVDGTATGEGSDTFSEVENLTGSNQDDTLLEGSEANNTLNGLAGADNVVGRGGADTLKGGGGPDTLDSQDGVEGNDAVDGGTGTDTCKTDATELSILSCEL